MDRVRILHNAGKSENRVEGRAFAPELGSESVKVSRFLTIDKDLSGSKSAKSRGGDSKRTAFATLTSTGLYIRGI